MRASKARTGRRAGQTCHRRRNAYGRPQGKGRRRGSPRSSTTSPLNCWRRRSTRWAQNAAPGVDRRTWKDYEADLEHNIEDLQRAGPTRSVSGTAVPARLHPQAGRSAAPARGRSLGGQDRPTGGGRAAERDLRGGLPRVLEWIPARSRRA